MINFQDHHTLYIYLLTFYSKEDLKVYLFAYFAHICMMLQNLILWWTINNYQNYFVYYKNFLKFCVKEPLQRLSWMLLVWLDHKWSTSLLSVTVCLQIILYFPKPTHRTTILQGGLVFLSEQRYLEAKILRKVSLITTILLLWVSKDRHRILYNLGYACICLWKIMTRYHSSGNPD